MKEKLIVKVMNFHSLIRVDSAKRQATKYMQMEREVVDIIDMIVKLIVLYKLKKGVK